MPDIITERVCGEPDGEIVVLLVGMRINRRHGPGRAAGLFAATGGRAGA